MSRSRLPPGAERIRALLDAGDHAAARAAAFALLADAEAGTEEREHAAATLASLSPERGALVASAIGVAIAIAVAILLAAG
jgi:hypothetical protein